MKPIDYMSMNGLEKFVYNLKNGIKNTPKAIGGFFKNIGSTIVNAVKTLGKDVKDIGVTFVEGDWKTKISFLVMGFGQLLRKQFARGIAFLGIEIAYIVYMANVGVQNLAKITTLGTVESGYDENYIYKFGDNSLLILLY